MEGAIRYTETSDGVRIAYSIDATSGGPPLVLVRGWISHLELMGEDADFVAFHDALAASYTVIRYDIRGNGLSERDVIGRVSLDELVLDLEAVMARTVADRAVLLAPCYGGPIAARYAARHPECVERIIFDGTFADLHDVAPKIKESLLSTVAMWDSDPKAAFTMVDFWTSPDHDDLRRARERRTQEAIGGAVAVELYEESFHLDVAEDLRRVSVPTLVIHRRNNRAVPFAYGQRVAGLVHDAEFAPLDGSAANAWEGDTWSMLKVMGNFLGAPLTEAFRPRIAVRPVVVLFTDLVGSTAGNLARGDDFARELMRVHEAVVRRLIEQRHGVMIRSTGDGMMAPLPSVTAALQCAVEMHAAFEQHNAEHPDVPVHIRIGIDAGEPLADNDELYGLTVAVAARTCDVASTGQTFVTRVVRDLARGKPFVFEPVGAHDFKGLDEPVDLFAVTARD